MIVFDIFNIYGMIVFDTLNIYGIFFTNLFYFYK
jgi:hypothetical protein